MHVPSKWNNKLDLFTLYFVDNSPPNESPEEPQLVCTHQQDPVSAASGSEVLLHTGPRMLLAHSWWLLLPGCNFPSLLGLTAKLCLF